MWYNVRMRIHLIGIGGVGMAALAVLLRRRGHEVSGCDVARSARTDWLASMGVPVAVGHDPSHVAGADEVVVTPAVAVGNAELVAARAACRVRARGEVLAELVNAAPDSVAVCGSHGKTTTATFTAKLLAALGEDVEWAIGGETGDFPVAGGGRGVLVVEADESDGTLSLYRPRTLVVTNCDYDHPDHFRTRDEYAACFDGARRRAADVVDTESLAPLPALDALGAFATLAPHNRRNARAAVEVALRRGHSFEAVAAALPEAVAALPDRRFELVCPDPAVYTDYAHHPAEMRCAISMARKVCAGRLRVIFQPHRYSRTKALLHDFPDAFEGADEVTLCPVYAAFEEPVAGGDITDLYDEMRARGMRPFLARDCVEAWERARASMAQGDVTLILGAGDIVSLLPRIRSECGGKSPHCGRTE